MKMTKTFMITIVLVLTSIVSTGGAQQEKTKERNLEFKLSSVRFNLTQYRNTFNDPRHPKPGNYVAEVIIPRYPRGPLDNQGWFDLIPHSEIYRSKSMSLQQQVFIENTLKAFNRNRPSWYPGRPKVKSSASIRDYLYHLPGQTEDDARKMALALLEVLDKQNAERLESTRQELKQRKEKAAQLEKSIGELQIKKLPIDEQLEKYKNTIYYQNIEDARKSIFEWSNLINMIDVDIVGIQAKLEMVGRQREENRKRKNPLRNLTEALFQIEMANKIELAGALARKKAGQDSLKKAIEFVGLSEETAWLAASLKSKEQSLADEQYAIEMGENMLADLPAYLKPIEVLDNTVTIYPLK